MKRRRQDQREIISDQIRRGRELVQRLHEQASPPGADEYDLWHACNKRLLRSLLTSTEDSEAQLRAAYRRLLLPSVSPRLCLQDVEAELRALEFTAKRLAMSDASADAPADGRVLVVYGRNEEAKEKVARFLMKLGLEPVLLDEEAAHGRTLIEKLEAQSSVDFAVVLLTGDDVGALASDAQNLRARARQNVIFELGYSIAKLSRERVCALYEERVELPSDFRGVEYKPLDGAGAWKSKLAKELHDAGLSFDPLKVL